MEIENVTALLQQHVYEQSLDQNQPDVRPADDGPHGSYSHTHAWEKVPQLPCTAREPFSPPTMGYPLPYLDVLTIQSKRLLPVTRKELDAQHRQAFAVQNDPVRNHSKGLDRERPDGEEGAIEEDRKEEADENAENVDADSVSVRTVKPPGTKGSAPAPLDFDAILRSVRLLVEPIVIPDLSHTGVKWQLAKSDHTAHDGGNAAQRLCVTVPNHSFDETQVKLFYPSGAKNTNMREYIKDTIQRHMTGFLTKPGDDSESPTKPSNDHTLTGSHSMPMLQTTDGDGSSTVSPRHMKEKKKHNSKPGRSSPTKLPLSPQKRTGVPSGARLSGAVSTSGLLNPELTRQAKDILAQLRANTNKINDLIG